MIDRILKKGDVVSVRAVVKHDTDPGDDYVHVRIGGEFKPTVTVDLGNIIAFIEPKIEIENLVRRTDDHEQEGIVRAMCEAGAWNLLWVEMSDRMTTWRTCDVEVVERPEPVAAPAPSAPLSMDEMAEAASQQAVADSDRRAGS